MEDDYLGNGGTDIADNFTFSKMEKTGGLFGSIIRLATAFPACDPETGHATGAWKVACESIDLDEVPLSDIADMISGFDCETITDFRLFNTGAFDNTPWQQALGELLLRLRVEKDDYQWIQCPNSESAVNMMNMVMDAHMPKDFFDDFVCGDEEYGLNEEARVTGIRPDGTIFLRRQVTAAELFALAGRYGEYLDFADEAEDFAPFLYDKSFPTRGAYLKVSSPAEIYRKAGFPKSPFFYTYNHLRDALVPKGFYPSNVHVKHPHGLTLEQIKRLPELLERPVVLMDSDRDDTMVAVLADVDGDGLPLIAALRPGANAVSGGRCVPGTIVCSVYGECEVETNMVLSVYSRQNFIRYFALLRDMDAFVFVSGRKIDALEDLSGLPLAENCSGLDIDRILQRPKCLG